MSVDHPGAGLPHHIINNIQYPQKYPIAYWLWPLRGFAEALLIAYQ